MSQIQPPTAAELGSFTRQDWHNAFRPEWETLIALGYVDGTAPQPSSNWIEGLSISDGEVPFFGGASGATLGTLIDPFSVLTTWYIVSDDAADTGAVWVGYGLDENGDEVLVQATTNGTTPVAFSPQATHINRVFKAAGNPAVGNIYVSDDSTGIPDLALGDSIQCISSPGENVAVNVNLMCPNDQTYVIPQVNFSADVGDGAIIRLWATKYTQTGGSLSFRAGQWFVYQNTAQIEFPLPVVLKPGECSHWTVERTAANNIACAMNAQYYILYGNETIDTSNDKIGARVIFK